MDFFGKLGSTLRTTVGVGVGEVKITLDAYEFRMGDPITGMLALELEEDISADRLVVSLVGRRKVVRLSRDSQGRRTTGSEWQTVHKFERELDGKRTYAKGSSSHRFNLRIPDKIEDKLEASGDGFISDVVRVASAIRSATRSAVEWKVIGFLHVPWKRNVKKTIDINVREPQP